MTVSRIKLSLVKIYVKPIKNTKYCAMNIYITCPLLGSKVKDKLSEDPHKVVRSHEFKRQHNNLSNHQSIIKKDYSAHQHAFFTNKQKFLLTWTSQFPLLHPITHYINQIPFTYKLNSLLYQTLIHWDQNLITNHKIEFLAVTAGRCCNLFLSL
jgi:hypothetical protein